MRNKLTWLEVTPSEIEAWKAAHPGEELPPEPDIVRRWCDDWIARITSSLLAEAIKAERQSAIMEALAELLRRTE